MRVVPVIDLMAGQVVHARRGDRASYAPIVTPLAASSDPLAVVDGLLAHAPFRTLYVADLDAIRGQGDHREVIARIRERHAALRLWVDAGVGSATALAPWTTLGVTPVIGTESLPSRAALGEIVSACPDALLSLDTRAGQPLGPAEIFDDATCWPGAVIVMTLDRVGSGSGPAVAALQEVMTRAAGRKVIAAGGVRSAEDLERLAALGVHAALVASAIHDGSLDRAALARFTDA